MLKNKREMVSYWKHKEAVEAKLMKTKEGHYVMQMEGEKYPFPGHPRGVLLYGNLSPLKHQIKNKIFNESWAILERQEDPTDYLKGAWQEIFELADKSKYDYVPYEQLVPAVKEIWRAMSTIDNPNVQKVKEVLCFILQEDDAYRFRFQWMVKYLPKWRKPTLKNFDKGLEMLEHGEMIGDMKERERLFRRIFMFMVKNNKDFQQFLKEVDWNKVKLSKADKYFFRAKWFKVDYPEYTY